MDTSVNAKTGILLNPVDIKLHRNWFRECVKLNGMYVIYRAPKPSKHWTTYAELETNYEPPVLVGCLFHEHPTQQTVRKLGWLSELTDGNSIISVEYNLPALQVGSLFIVPSYLDNSQGRLFRVVKMSTSTIYPSAVDCEIAPEYEDTIVPEAVYDYERSNFNLLNQEEDRRFK